MTTREALHALIDTLPDARLDAARRYLETLRLGDDPVLLALMNAADDDEPETDEERAAVAEAYEDIRGGHTVSMEEIKRELGL
jgi:hypothetical protein